MEPALTTTDAYWEKVDPAKNQRRWYRVEFVVDLFDTPIVKSSWGRLGQAGQSKMTILPNPDDWPRFLTDVELIRAKHGYTKILLPQLFSLSAVTSKKLNSTP